MDLPKTTTQRISRRPAAILAIACSLVLSAPAGAQVGNAARPKPFAAFSNSAQALRDSAVARARAQVGKRYRLGGESPERGFDCSGLVRYVMSALGVPVPRVSWQQAGVGLAVARDTSDLRPGDLLTFGRGKRVSHVGIYVGNGRYVHASSMGGRVMEVPLARSGRKVKPWLGVRRLVADSLLAETAAPPAQAATPTTSTGSANQ
ncbi:MAG TPA: C40 family peptidase [Gemmatimonadaceae bacterium]